jgi:hypothetical protein
MSDNTEASGIAKEHQFLSLKNLFASYALTPATLIREVLKLERGVDISRTSPQAVDFAISAALSQATAATFFWNPDRSFINKTYNLLGLPDIERAAAEAMQETLEAVGVRVAKSSEPLAPPSIAGPSN